MYIDLSKIISSFFDMFITNCRTTIGGIHQQ
jgi:hypothetical protein